MDNFVKHPIKSLLNAHNPTKRILKPIAAILPHYGTMTLPIPQSSLYSIPITPQNSFIHFQTQTNLDNLPLSNKITRSLILQAGN